MSNRKNSKPAIYKETIDTKSMLLFLSSIAISAACAGYFGFNCSKEVYKPLDPVTHLMRNLCQNVNH